VVGVGKKEHRWIDSVLLIENQFNFKVLKPVQVKKWFRTKSGSGCMNRF